MRRLRGRQLRCCPRWRASAMFWIVGAMGWWSVSPSTGGLTCARSTAPTLGRKGQAPKSRPRASAGSSAISALFSRSSGALRRALGSLPTGTETSSSPPVVKILGYLVMAFFPTLLRVLRGGAAPRRALQPSSSQASGHTGQVDEAREQLGSLERVLPDREHPAASIGAGRRRDAQDGLAQRVPRLRA
jgi:hypothetical protein